MSRSDVVADEKDETSGLDHSRKLSLARLLMPFFSSKVSVKNLGAH
jgi:hypothetical protein